MNWKTIIGIIFIVGGIGFLIISFVSAVHKGGGKYYIFWEAPLTGVITPLRGLGVLPGNRR